jgi:hypothetical protein
MFEGDFSDMYTRKFPLMSMKGIVEGLACPDPVAGTSISLSGNCVLLKTTPLWESGSSDG